MTREQAGGAAAAGAPRAVGIPAGEVELQALVQVPAKARGVVIFVHGSGSSRFSPRNRFVAEALRAGGFATLLMDLLSRDEEVRDERTGELRFAVAALAQRVVAAIDWLAGQGGLAALPLGLFGASTGAAAALIAAAQVPQRVRAVVSRGGRPDLAGGTLIAVRAPTLLIVGARDEEVLELNRAALGQLQAEKELVIVPGAGHLFAEPGRLALVAERATAWFARHL